MSCYFRHMKDILAEAGITLTPQNKKDLDRLIHQLVDQEYKNCSPTWKKIKEQFLAEPKTQADFIKKLKAQWQGDNL